MGLSQQSGRTFSFEVVKAIFSTVRIASLASHRIEAALAGAINPGNFRPNPEIRPIRRRVAVTRPRGLSAKKKEGGLLSRPPFLQNVMGVTYFCPASNFRTIRATANHDTAMRTGQAMSQRISVII